MSLMPSPELVPTIYGEVTRVWNRRMRLKFKFPFNNETQKMTWNQSLTHKVLAE